jgi:hypothetical protein
MSPVWSLLAFLAGLEEGYHSGKQALFHQQLVKLVEVLPVNIEHYLATTYFFMVLCSEHGLMK